LPEVRSVGLVLTQNFPPSTKDDIACAFHSPVSGIRLAELARGINDAALIVSDATRAVPTSEVLPFIIEELEAARVSIDNIRAVVGTGVHRPASEREMREILGERWYGKVKN
jgi:nickel-dependent lactate racemase